MIGNTLSAKVPQRLPKVLKQWVYPAAGLIIMVTLCVFSIGALLKSYGFGQQQTIQPADAHYAAVEGNNDNEEEEEVEPTTPKRLLLPSVDLGIDIIDSTIGVESNEWPLSDTSSHYANFTPGLGSDRGTLLLYGHNTWSALRKTSDLEVGDKLVLIDENNRRWKFKLTRQEKVTPDKVEFIYEDVPFRVVLFTCDGWNDQYRRLMYFEPLN